jgi:endonuclease-3
LGLCPGTLGLNAISIDFLQTFRLLKKTYPTHPFALIHGSDPYKILIGCILSLRTQDTVSLPASQRLFSRAANLEKMVALSAAQIEKIIYPVGFYRNKAKQIVEINRRLTDEFDGKVPPTMEGLLDFKGVGRKTANLVLSLGFNQAAICVDIHVHRISNRLGWIKTEKPDDSEFALMEIVPKRYWKTINSVMVCHGQTICRPTRPKCELCPIIKHCAQVI